MDFDWSNAFSGWGSPEDNLFSGASAKSLGFDDVFKAVSKYAPMLQLGSAIVGGISEYTSKSKQAGRMNDAIDRAQAENSAALRERASQQTAQSKQDQNVRARAAMIEKARLKAIAAESGLSGNSFDRLSQAEDWAAGTDIGQLQQNEAALQRQNQREEARIAAAANQDRSRIQAPSMFETGLGLLGSVINYGVGNSKANPSKSAGLTIFQ